MLKFSVNKGTVEVDAGGSVIELATEMNVAIRALWLSLDGRDPVAAENFKRAIVGSIGQLDSIVWDKDGEEMDDVEI